jgi:hypothetical protein
MALEAWHKNIVRCESLTGERLERSLRLALHFFAQLIGNEKVMSGSLISHEILPMRSQGSIEMVAELTRN